MSIFRTSCPMQGYKVGPLKHFHFELLGPLMFYLVYLSIHIYHHCPACLEHTGFITFTLNQIHVFNFNVNAHRQK